MSNLPALYVTVYFSIILACAITVINCRYRGTVLNDVFNTMNITKSGYFKMVLRCVVFYTPFLNKIAVAYICDLILKDKNHARFLLAVGTRIIGDSLGHCGA